jgi:predicted nucleic acid-binding protein
VAAYFCDTSAIVKRYVSEQGTPWLNSITDRSAGGRVFVAGITGVETVAAITRKARGGGLALSDAAAAIAAFRYDFANEFSVVAITPRIITEAMTLAERHGLRGYDAVQLASALVTQNRRQARGLPSLTFLSADVDLNAAGVTEGLNVDDPNTH